MTYREDYWQDMAKKMGYNTEEEFWDAEYKESTQGAMTIRTKMRVFDLFAPSTLCIRDRLRNLGYDIKGQGGPNNTIENLTRRANQAQAARS